MGPGGQEGFSGRAEEGVLPENVGGRNLSNAGR